jgi:hypothetical protein
VVPIIEPVTEPSVYAFSYTEGARGGEAAFLISGIPETTGGPVAARLNSIVDQLEARPEDVGAGWSRVTAIPLYGDEEVGGPDIESLLR